MQEMTKAQFNALAQLMRCTSERVRVAAQLQLVDGVRAVDAARAAGCTSQALGDAVTRYRKALRLARLAAGVADGAPEG